MGVMLTINSKRVRCPRTCLMPLRNNHCYAPINPKLKRNLLTPGNADKFRLKVLVDLAHYDQF